MNGVRFTAAQWVFKSACLLSTASTWSSSRRQTRQKAQPPPGWKAVPQPTGQRKLDISHCSVLDSSCESRLDNQIRAPVKSKNNIGKYFWYGKIDATARHTLKIGRDSQILQELLSLWHRHLVEQDRSAGIIKNIPSGSLAMCDGNVRC